MIPQRGVSVCLPVSLLRHAAELFKKRLNGSTSCLEWRLLWTQGHFFKTPNPRFPSLYDEGERNGGDFVQYKGKVEVKVKYI